MAKESAVKRKRRLEKMRQRYQESKAKVLNKQLDENSVSKKSIIVTKSREELKHQSITQSLRSSERKTRAEAQDCVHREENVPQSHLESNEALSPFQVHLENIEQHRVQSNGENESSESGLVDKKRRKYLKRLENETPEKYQARLDNMRERYIRHRKSESFQARKARLEKTHQRYLERIKNETPEQHQARLEGMRKRYIRLRRNESSEERAKRLEKNHQRYLKRLENETSEHRKARLESMRQRYIRVRRSESSPERKKRLEKTHQRYLDRLRKETAEQYRARLDSMRQYYLKHGRRRKSKECKSFMAEIRLKRSELKSKLDAFDSDNENFHNISESSR